MPSAEDLLGAHVRISSFIHNTPVLTSRSIDTIAGCELYFKCENFQRMGAFKMRGAVNAILQLSKEEKLRGVVTHSSGNFAQALSLAAKEIGVKAYIVMPDDAPEVKKAAVRGYEGEVIECEPSIADRERTADKVQQRTGATFLHPYDDHKVILGQGTAALELLQEVSDIDFLLAPVGGGGLIAGTALAANYFSDGCRVIGGEPFAVDDAFRSLKSGRIEGNESIDTIADGLRTTLGQLTFPIIQRYVERIIRVEEQEIVDAMRLIYERMKIVIEPSCSVPLAAVLKEKGNFKSKRIGIVLSGGNVDVRKLPF